MKFILQDPSFLMDSRRFSCGENRYKWHPDFPQCRIDFQRITDKKTVKPLIIMLRHNMAKSDQTQYLIGIDIRLYPIIESDPSIPVKKISFEIYKGKIPHTLDNAIRSYHFPHARFNNVWMELKMFDP